MESWSRRIKIVVFAGALALLASSTAQATAAHGASRSLRVERQEVQPGLLPAALSYVHGLIARALAVVAPVPDRTAPAGTAGAAGDNGAGIDPNGG